jgi:hypothetical protein
MRHNLNTAAGATMGQTATAKATTNAIIKEVQVEHSSEPKHAGVEFPKYFTARLEAGKTPYDDVQWETRNATIGNDKGSVIFEQRDIEVPADWSQTATNIVASKYFHGKLGSPDRERSVAELVHRVVDTIADWGLAGGYFATQDDGENFRNELAHMMLHQKAAFNSPVWFNVGVKESRGYGWFYEADEDKIRKMTSEARPQCSACFIVSVKDSLESILDLAKTEGRGRYPFGRRQGQRTAFLHEGLRCLRRRDQIGRQDQARGEDGDPQCRSPRYRAVRVVQGQRREEGPYAHRSGLRFLARRRRL